jgi:hypothetical protein
MGVFVRKRSREGIQGETFNVYRSPFAVRRSPFTVRRSPFAVERSPFAVHRRAFGGVYRALAFGSEFLGQIPIAGMRSFWCQIILLLDKPRGAIGRNSEGNLRSAWVREIFALNALP